MDHETHMKCYQSVLEKTIGGESRRGKNRRGKPNNIRPRKKFFREQLLFFRNREDIFSIYLQKSVYGVNYHAKGETVSPGNH